MRDVEEKNRCHLKKHKICNGFSSCIGMHSRSAAAAVALTLSQSAAAAVQSQLPVDTPARTDGANKKCIHMRVSVCGCIHTYIMHVTATPSHAAPHPHKHTHTHTQGERERARPHVRIWFCLASFSSSPSRASFRTL